MISTIQEEAQNLLPEIIRWRRDFHQHPELRFKEFRTSEIVATHLRRLGIETFTGIGKTGVVGIIRGKQPGKTILARFDMDALPIQEENDIEYRSINSGVMHACGHDGHVATGMAVACILMQHQEQIAGNVKLVFQPAEEGAGGALAMIEDGVLDNPKVDHTLGMHIQSQTRSGTLLIGEGPILSAADSFRIIINGKGGHGALPQESVDPIVIAAQIITGLQTIISRNLDQMETAVLSIGSIQSGSAFNIIPDTAVMTGTIRAFKPEIQEMVYQRMRAIVELTAKAMNGSAKIEITPIVSATVNEPEITAQVREIAVKMIGKENINFYHRDTPSDDIAEFLKAAPGCHFILGAGGPDYHPHHNAKFNFDEKALPLGTALLCASILHFLK